MARTFHEYSNAILYLIDRDELAFPVLGAATMLDCSPKAIVDLCLKGQLEFVGPNCVSVYSLQKYIFSQVPGSSIAPDDFYWEE